MLPDLSTYTGVTVAEISFTSMFMFRNSYLSDPALVASSDYLFLFHIYVLFSIFFILTKILMIFANLLSSVSGVSLQQKRHSYIILFEG